MSELLRVGAARVDLDEGLVQMEGREVRLRPKTLEVLRYLVQHRGRVASKAELMDAVWPDAAVTPDSLVQCVLEIRRALDDDGQEVVKTVPSRGYLLVDDAARLDAPEAAIRRRGARAGWFVLATVLVLGAAAATLRDTGETVSIAVLPFQPLGDERSDAYLELGLADAVITRLSNVSRITVSPTSTVVDFLASRESSLDRARALGVETVLEGTVQRREGRVRISVQLLDVSGGKPIWAESFDEDVEEFFALQDAISERVAAALVAELAVDDVSGSPKRHTDNLEAYRLYWEGRYYWDRRDARNVRKALDYFNQAARLDPEYALAHAGSAYAYAVSAVFGYMPPSEARAGLERSVHRAVALTPTLAEANLPLAALRLTERDWDGADRAYRRAIELDPSYATAHNWYGWFLESMRRYQESTAHRRIALELDPLNLTINAALGHDYLIHARVDEAEAQLLRTVDLEPEFAMAHQYLAELYSSQGRHQDAIDAAARTGLRWELGYAYAVAGRDEEALSILAELEAKSRTSYVSPYHRSVIHAGLGNDDEAFALLEQAYREGTTWLCRLHVDHRLASLREDPRFEDLSRRLGLPGPTHTPATSDMERD